MTLKMRELRGDDLFPFLAIIGKLDIKDEVREALSSNIDTATLPQDHKGKKRSAADNAAAAEKRGLDIAVSVGLKALQGIGGVRDDINGLLASLTDTDIDTIKRLGLKEYTGLIMELFKHPDLKGFLSFAVSPFGETTE